MNSDKGVIKYTTILYNNFQAKTDCCNMEIRISLLYIGKCFNIC